MSISAAVAPQQLLDANVGHLTDAVCETFGSFCGSTPAHVGNDEVREPFDGIVGMVSLVGECIWSLMLCLPKATAEAVSQSFAGFEIEFESDDMGDVVGELANVLGGDVAARLDRAGVRTDMSLPTVARGTSIKVLLPRDCVWTQLHFSSACGEFWLTVGLAAHP